MIESSPDPDVSIDIRHSLKPSHAVVEAVSAAEGVNPLDLERPLYRDVDPDALDALFQDDSSVSSVQFDYHGYEVVVSGEGTVSVCERTAIEEPDSE